MTNSDIEQIVLADQRDSIKLANRELLLGADFYAVNTYMEADSVGEMLDIVAKREAHTEAEKDALMEIKSRIKDGSMKLSLRQMHGLHDGLRALLYDVVEPDRRARIELGNLKI